MRASELFMLTAAVVAASIDGDEPDLQPGDNGQLTIDTPLGPVDVTFTVPAPLRPNGMHRVHITGTQFTDVDQVNVVEPTATPVVIGTPIEVVTPPAPVVPVVPVVPKPGGLA